MEKIILVILISYCIIHIKCTGVGKSKNTEATIRKKKKILCSLRTIFHNKQKLYFIQPLGKSIKRTHLFIFLTRSIWLRSMLVSSGCYDKLPQIQCLKVTQIYFLQFQKSAMPSRLSELCSFQRLQGRIYFLACSSSQRLPGSFSSIFFLSCGSTLL